MMTAAAEVPPAQPIKVIGTEHFGEQAEATIEWIKLNMKAGQTLALEVPPGAIEGLRGEKKQQLSEVEEAIDSFWRPIVQHCNENKIKLVPFSPHYPARLQRAIPVYEQYKEMEQVLRNVLKAFQESGVAAGKFGLPVLAGRLERLKAERQAFAGRLGSRQITLTKSVKKRLGDLNASALSLWRTINALKQDPKFDALVKEMRAGRFRAKGIKNALTFFGAKKKEASKAAQLSQALDFPVQERMMARKLARARPDAVLCGYHHAEPLAEALQSTYDLKAEAKILYAPKIAPGDRRRSRTLRKWYAERQRQRLGNQWRQRRKTVEKAKMARRRVA